MTEAANKIPAQKTGSEFLVSSHFTISHEDRWAPSRDPLAYQSIFKKDYPPLPLTKRERIPSPSPAQIMHKDQRYADHCSMTRSQFVEKPLNPLKDQDAAYALTKTNFKMDSDKKLKSFQTTHKEYFPVRPVEDARNPAGKKEWMRSHIPQGTNYFQCHKMTWCRCKGWQAVLYLRELWALEKGAGCCRTGCTSSLPIQTGASYGWITGRERWTPADQSCFLGTYRPTSQSTPTPFLFLPHCQGKPITRNCGSGFFPGGEPPHPPQAAVF